jgi:acetyltransferase-like isoleucine patch superfamily enzyme
MKIAAKKMLRKAFGRIVLSAFRLGGAELYEALQSVNDEYANQTFSNQFCLAGRMAQVRHPIYLKNSQYFEIGDNFTAMPGLRLEAWDKYASQHFHPLLKIGNNVCLNWNVHIGVINRIEIGHNVLVGSHVLITDHSHGDTSSAALAMPPIIRPLTSKGSVVIEENVWIGEGACILSGVTIGRGAVIGANAVVTSNVAPGAVIGGIPARQLKLQPHNKISVIA